MYSFRDFFRRLKEKVWFYPAVFSSLAVLLAFIVISYDMNYFYGSGFEVPSMFLTSIDFGKEILGIVAGAFITITTFTFSTTMVVLTMYTSQYTPRVIQNFLSQRVTLQSFAVFVSGFLYTMIAFLFLSNYADNARIVSATVGIVYILVGLVFFFRFINSVVSYIQAGNLLARLKDNGYESIKTYKQSIKGKELLGEAAIEKIEQGTSFCVEKDGYFQKIDFKKMIEIAKEYNIELFFQIFTGQFVTKKRNIGTYREIGQPLTKEQKEKLLEKIRQNIFIGKERTEVQDFGYSIQKVVEVGMRALSPGINDPNTAVQCTQILALMIRELSELSKGYLILEKEEDQEKIHIAPVIVCAEAMDFELLLTNSFQQLVHYGSKDVMVMRGLLKALQGIDENATEDNHRTIMKFSQYIMRKIEKESYDPEELDVIQKEMRELKSND